MASLRKQTVQQTATAAWSGDTTIRTDIERVGLITRIDMTCEITPSATLTAANQPDGLFRLIQNMRIQGGTKTYFNIPADDGCEGGVLLHYMNKYDGHGIGHADGAIASGGPNRLITLMNYVYHCGTRPRGPYNRDNPFDLSAFIPAFGESQISAEYTTSGNDVMDDTVTISSAVMVFTLRRVLGDEAAIKGEMAAQDLNYPDGANGMHPVWSATNRAHTGTTTDYDSFTTDVPVGAFLARIWVLEQDATTTRTLRAGDETTRLNLHLPIVNETLYQGRVEMLTGHLEYGSVLTANSGALESAGTEKFGVDFNASAPQGVFHIDLKSMTFDPIGKDYGWDLRNYRTGDMRVGHFVLTYASGDDSLFIWERYEPYFGPLAPRI